MVMDEVDLYDFVVVVVEYVLGCEVLYCFELVGEYVVDLLYQVGDGVVVDVVVLDCDGFVCVVDVGFVEYVFGHVVDVDLVVCCFDVGEFEFVVVLFGLVVCEFV